MRGWWLGAALAVALGTAEAQVGTWRNYTSMQDVRDVARAGDTFWAATGGGLFSWQPGRPGFIRLTNADGLRNMDVTAVGVDPDGDIWAGCSNGFLHVYSPATGRWTYIPDIAGSPQVNKRINRLLSHGDTTLICTEFGLSIFHRGRLEFGDTYTKFGTLLANTRVGVAAAIYYDNRLWAAVRSGPTGNYIAVANLSNPNLLPPESWTLLSIVSPSNTVRTLDVFGGRLFAGTAAGLFFLQDSSWLPVDSLQGHSVLATASSPEGLLVATTDQAVFLLDAQNAVTPHPADPLPLPPTTMIAGADGSPVVGTAGRGLVDFDGAWRSHIPNGPNSNQFISVTVDPAGSIWGASGYSGNGKGFYRFNGRDWKSFTAADNGLPTDDYFRLSVGCNGGLWASSWGRGAVEMPAGSDSIDPGRIYGRNVGMVGLPNDTNYIVVSSVGCDGAGNVWMTVINAADGNVLVARDPAGTWSRIPVSYGGVTLTSLTDNIPIDRSFAFDAFGNLWAASRDRTFRGVLAFANGGAIRGTARYFLTENNGLPSNEIRTLVTDRDNDIWIGTDRGIAIVLDPERPTSAGAIAAYRPLNGLTINTIAVDPLNQKWIGTPEGVILLSPDGTQQVASYTVDNTGGKLIDNDVRSIAIDPRTGTVYFGTANGLSSLSTAGPAPVPAFDVLQVYPNPFRIPAESPMTVDGLVENSSLKILAVDGRVVRSIVTPGGRIGFWDGRDEQGVPVASGVYIVVAYSEDGSKVATGKVAVVRR
jgi:ligand-binding sensor domain-containing protein